MKKFSQLFASLVMTAAILLTGCGKEEPTPEQKPEIITYSATYTVTEISDDFFTLGSFLVSYADKDGKDQVEELKSKELLPYTVTVEGLKEESKLSFDLIYGYFDKELTKDKYTFERRITLTIKGSNGSLHSSTIKGGSIEMGKDKVKAYLDKVTQEEGFVSTVKQFIAK